jgi:hypothetical protein
MSDVMTIEEYNLTRKERELLNIGRKQGAVSVLDRVIDLVRTMPNADDRYDKLCKGVVPKLLDGGSVHRFTLIKELEKLKEHEKK